MAPRFGLFISVCLWATPLNLTETVKRLVIWNVGQGQWVTLISGQTCWHFDAGGERAPWKAITGLCRERYNRISFSHWDWDHIAFAGQIARTLPRVCIQHRPAGGASPRKEKILMRLPDCREPTPFLLWRGPSTGSANSQSLVVWWDGLLIPGDSTSHEEKAWVKAFARLRDTKILVLGHHGSRTSTSRLLLAHLPYLQTAIASARRAKYGHPHALVTRELHSRRVPLLRTEDWGTLVFDL